MAVAGKPILKKIYFADFNDIRYFQKKIEPGFIIFDKEIAVTQSNTEIPDDKSLGSYIKNTIIQRELTKTLKDKKIIVIVYILYGSSAKSIKDNIENFISPAINKNIKFSFFLLHENKRKPTTAL